MFLPSIIYILFNIKPTAFSHKKNENLTTVCQLTNNIRLKNKVINSLIPNFVVPLTLTDLIKKHVRNFKTL